MPVLLAGVAAVAMAVLVLCLVAALFHLPLVWLAAAAIAVLGLCTIATRHFL